jgi:RNA polymerase sigma-70 factor (ECF subfamily)
VQTAGEIVLMPPGNPGGAWLDRVFREHYPRLVSLLARITGDRGEAEEIAADVFCKLARQRPPDLQEAAPWIYRVAVNAGLDAVRSSSRRRRREDVAAQESRRSGHAPTALEEVLREERRARVREVLREIKPRDAQLLLLRSEGMAYRELAAAVGIQPGSVGTLLARAEAEFERRYRARYGEER